MKSGSFKSVAVLALLLALVLSVMPSVAQQLQPSGIDRGAPASEVDALEDITAANVIRDAQGRVAYTVVLSEAPAVEAVLAAGGRNVSGASVAASAQRQVVASQQMNFTAAASALGASKYTSGSFLSNFVGVFIDPSQAAALRALPGVESVFPSVRFERTDTTSTQQIGATDAWDSALHDITGDGKIIAVIDSGIDFSHTNFGGTGDYNTEIGDGTGAPTFGAFPIVNVGDQKVIGGYDFVGDAYAGDSADAAPDLNPADCPIFDGGGHGTHVAGSAAGYGVNADGSTYTGTLDDLFDATFPNVDPAFRIGPGVAPRAALIALRVFGCNGSTGFAATAIDAAAAGGVDTNEDGTLDVTFEVPDVINMSLGSSYGSSASDSFYNDIIDNAIAMGITVVTSAGNSADLYYITGSPGTTNAAMSVANVTDTTNVGGAIDVTIDGATTQKFAAYSLTYNAGNFPPTTVTDFVRPDGTTNNNTQLGCDAAGWPVADLNGATVIIDRGSCNFSVKLAFAFNANAGAVIMVSTGTAIGMGGDAIPGYDLISVMVSSTDGATIKAALAAGTLDSVTFDSSYTFVESGIVANVASSSTSRGPSSGTRIGLKPDVASIGDTVVSAGAGTGNGIYNISGTSMASPHAAGVVALVAEKYPALTAIQRKAVVMNTATTLSATAGGVNYSPQRVGTGVTNVTNAMNTTVLAYSTENPDGVSLRFDHYSIAEGEVVNATKSITLWNWGASDVTYDVAVVQLSDIVGLAFTVGQPTVVVPAGGTATVDVTLSGSIDAAAAGLRTDPTWNFGSWWQILEEAALIQFANQGAGSDLHVATYTSAQLGSDVEVAVDNITLASTSGELNVPVTGDGFFINTAWEFSASLTSLFELTWQAPAASDLSDSIGQLQAVGTSLDSGTGLSYFALVLNDTFLTPFEVDPFLYIDYDKDGTADTFVDSGIATFARPLACNDVQAPTCYLVNDYYQNALNTYALGGNRVLVWPVAVAAFDGDNATTDFDYWVDVYNYTNGDLISTTGTLTGDYGKAAYTSVGSLLGGANPASFPVGITGLGDDVDVNYDFTGYTEAPSILALHHHNAESAMSYEIIDVTVDPANSFALLSPANNSMVFNPAGITEVTWEQGSSQTFEFILLQTSGNTPLDGVAAVGEILRLEDLDWSPNTDDGLTCDSEICTLDVTGALDGLENGTYVWTVLGNPGTESETEAYNGPYQFVVYRNSVDLLINGDFEVDLDNNKRPDGWNVKGATKSRLRCNTETKTYAHSGDCAFEFRPGEPRARLIQRSAAGSELGVGVTLDAGIWVKTNKTSMNGVMLVKVIYDDINPATGSAYRDTLKISVDGQTTGYEHFTGSITTQREVAILRVIVRNRQPVRKALVDLVTLGINGVDGVAPVTDFAADLLPVPEAPADFRGRD